MLKRQIIPYNPKLKELAQDAIDVRLSRLLNSFSTDELTEEEIAQEVENVRASFHSNIPCKEDIFF
jgi:hypothetical protein